MRLSFEHCFCSFTLFWSDSTFFARTSCSTHFMVRRPITCLVWFRSRHLVSNLKCFLFILLFDLAPSSSASNFKLWTLWLNIVLSQIILEYDQVVIWLTFRNPTPYSLNVPICGWGYVVFFSHRICIHISQWLCFNEIVLLNTCSDHLF